LADLERGNDLCGLFGGEETFGARELLGRPVEHRGALLGRTVDLVFDRSLSRLLGLEIRSQQGITYFVPWLACKPEADRIEIPQPVSLLSTVELGYYRATGLTLSHIEQRGADSSSGLRPDELVVNSQGSVGPSLPAA
jgi:hypothetical protein